MFDTRLLSVALAATLLGPTCAAPVDDVLPRTPLSARGTGQYGNEETVVDLGYGLFNGTLNSTFDQIIWQGIPFARNAEETRWQLPQEPKINRNSISQAQTPGNRCPQGAGAPSPSVFNYTGSEDCLVLNVYGPRKARNLPVFVWIHGGGYDEGSAANDFTQLIKSSKNGFIAVAIQYRLGAFGFLAGADLQKHGVSNLALYDQQFALKWVQKHIRTFGGDPGHVTIGGESAGAGSVMLQAMAFGGSQGDSLFQNIIAASPYLPTQPRVDGEEPTSAYLRFAKLAGCYSGPTEGQARLFRPDGSILKCLRSKDTDTLQRVNSAVSSSALYGQWAFIPVTDGKFLQGLPSRQLASGRLNGRRMLSANNADEGVLFTPQNVTTEADFEGFVHTLFPGLDRGSFKAILSAYPTQAETSAVPSLRYGTLGDTGPTALDVSPFGTGQQQRADNFYGEATFVCPSYWLSDAFRESYHYQYSVLPASHGTNLNANFGLRAPNIAPAFSDAVMSLWYNFIIHHDPRARSSSIPAVCTFAPWQGGRHMLNLNQTGGILTPGTGALGINITVDRYVDPGLMPDIKEVNAYTWEGGRGRRCELLRRLGSQIQE